ncbi:MAG: peptide-methionine (S)-S-oxide reductase MsrA [Fluviicola sp.]|nr:peptide-methionine (S)-S-oxide reductase MsrA [Fluviicola sp.]
MKNVLLILTTFFALQSCARINDPSESTDNKGSQEFVKIPIDKSQTDTAYFAAGCFWCVEAIYESVRGVIEVESGYSGGVIKNPTYEQICTGKLKHAEAVKVIYDPKKVSFSTLVDVFFNSHDPSTLNRQGPDSGPQYRSIAFYQTDEEKVIVNDKIKALKEAGTFSKITTEVKAFEVFYKAEEYHQDYEKNNPNQGYIRAVSIPRLNKFKEKMPEVLK